jgi:hypothetical protein
MTVETSGWSGDGDFTILVVDALKAIDLIDFIKVEDAPAGRSEPSYAFISNEVFVRFRTTLLREPVRRFLVFPSVREVAEKSMSLAGLARTLTAVDGVGEPDFEDEGMIQYLRAHRIVAPYQTRGFKLVEMVRIYEVGTEPKR